MSRCTESECGAARPEMCGACNGRRLRQMMVGQKLVPIQSDGKRASFVRVFYDDGSFTQHKVDQ